MDTRVPDGRSKLPVRRIGEQGQTVVDEGHCRECGADVGAGYLCDECDEVVIE